MAEGKEAERLRIKLKNLEIEKEDDSLISRDLFQLVRRGTELQLSILKVNFM